MKLHIKNMVCHRCKLAVADILHQNGYHPHDINLGEAVINEELTGSQLQELDEKLKHIGFELIDDKKARIVEKIKNAIVELVHHSEGLPTVNLSTYLSQKLDLVYNHLSDTFSDLEGTTVERYYIAQRIERVKELLIYDELTLSQIADQLGYSSVAYLSNQFKKETGLTPSHFKQIREDKRRNIEEL